MSHPPPLPVKLTSLDPPRQQRIIDLLCRGNYLAVACEASGITFQGFRHWQRRWEEGDPEAVKFDEFFRAVQTAVRVGECSALDEVRAGSPGWQSNAWFLERRFPQRWGKQERSPIPSVPRDLSNLSDEELERHRQEQERRAGRTG